MTGDGDLAPLAERLRDAERSMRGLKEELYESVRQDPEFQAEGIALFPFDTLENMDPVIGLLGDPGAAQVCAASKRTMIDLGCANGELGFVFERAGFSVALLDRAHVAEPQGSVVRQNAPLVASIIARTLHSSAVILDEDLDDGFDPRRVAEGFARTTGDARFGRFHLGVMVGVLYHLKNPYSVIEKLGRLCDHLIVGTWVADCLPDRRRMIRDEQLVYLLRDRQLANDPTNYWVFTPRSFRVLVERSGWRILAQRTVTGHRRRRERWLAPLRRWRGVSPPDDVKQRVFYLLERREQAPGASGQSRSRRPPSPSAG